MMSGTLVMKFGGSSVGTTAALSQVLSIVLHEQPRWEKLLLVVSALDGVTDALIEAAHLAQMDNRRGYRRIAATLRTRHLALVEKLPLGTNERGALLADIDRLLFDVLNICEAVSANTTGTITPDTIDAVIGTGEKLAARIVAALLRQNNVRGVSIDTTDLIVTDDVHGNATPNMALTRTRVSEYLLPMLQRSIVPVLTGFIGGTQSGKPTTLGRGGSDYTASILSVCASADEVWIWTDVDGIMSADPHEVSQAQVIAELSYEEMAELAYFGARVLHARMVNPLREHAIPLRVKNVFKPQQPGSLIYNVKSTRPSIKAITSIQGVALTANESGSLSQIAGLVDDTMFHTIGTHAEVMISAQASAQSFACFVIPTNAGPDAVHVMQSALETRLFTRTESGSIEWTVRPVVVITAIGAALNGNAALNTVVMQALDNLRVLAVAQSPAQCSLSLVVEPKDAPAALRQLHTLAV